MEKEIHRIEKTVFLERFWASSKEIFYKKSETFKDRKKKVLYENQEDKESIFFEGFFVHRGKDIQTNKCFSGDCLYKKSIFL